MIQLPKRWLQLALSGTVSTSQLYFYQTSYPLDYSDSRLFSSSTSDFGTFVMTYYQLDLFDKNKRYTHSYCHSSPNTMDLCDKERLVGSYR